MICFVSCMKPISCQASSNGVRNYKRRLANEFIENFQALYPDLPINDTLYSKMLYIHSKPDDGDIDNLSKPFVDAFKTIIYPDDKTINHRICTKIRLKDFQALQLRLDVLPDEVAERFSELLEAGNEYIVYYEIASFSDDMISIGGI